jgi:dTDP-4-dehydrorhamnose reductase
MKTVVLGSAGQFGRDLCPRLAGQVIALTRADVDLRDDGAMRRCLEAHRPNVVINCAAYNLVDRAEAEVREAFAVNADAMRALATVCAEIDALLVHLSTDYVFGLDAARREPYAEADAPGPVSAYGLSKLIGEYWVRQLCPRHCVVRTCGLYGRSGSGGKGGNFVETMLRLAEQGKPLRVVNDQRCTPSFTVDVATAVAQIIRGGEFGIYHVTNRGDCSWFEFAREIFHIAGMKPNLTAVSSTQFGAVARRPAYSVLSGQRLEGVGVGRLRPWQDALAEYLRIRAAE